MFLFDYAGWIALLVAQITPWPQLIRCWKTKEVSGISLGTYIALVISLVFYLIHAIKIQDLVFIIAQSTAIITNTTILILLLKYRKK